MFKTIDWKGMWKKIKKVLPTIGMLGCILFIDGAFGTTTALWSLLIGTFGFAAVRIWKQWDQVRALIQLTSDQAYLDKVQAREWKAEKKRLKEKARRKKEREKKKKQREKNATNKKR